MILVKGQPKALPATAAKIDRLGVFAFRISQHQFPPQSLPQIELLREAFPPQRERLNHLLRRNTSLAIFSLVLTGSFAAQKVREATKGGRRIESASLSETQRIAVEHSSPQILGGKKTHEERKQRSWHSTKRETVVVGDQRLKSQRRHDAQRIMNK